MRSAVAKLRQVEVLAGVTEPTYYLMISVPTGPDMRMAVLGAPSYFAKCPTPLRACRTARRSSGGRLRTSASTA